MCKNSWLQAQPINLLERIYCIFWLHTQTQLCKNYSYVLHYTYIWFIKGLNNPLCMEWNYANYRRCGRGRGRSPLLKNKYIFFLGPWHLVCQFIKISNQMGKKYIMLYYIKKFFRCLILRQLSPFDWKCL